MPCHRMIQPDFVDRAVKLLFQLMYVSCDLHWRYRQIMAVTLPRGACQQNLSCLGPRPLHQMFHTAFVQGLMFVVYHIHQTSHLGADHILPVLLLIRKSQKFCLYTLKNPFIFVSFYYKRISNAIRALYRWDTNWKLV